MKISTLAAPFGATNKFYGGLTMENYSYSIVERLSFLRYGGTEDELRAAHILLDEIKALGGTGEIEDFQIPAYELEKCTAKIVAPFEKELEVIPYGLSGNLPEGGVDLKFMYAQNGTAEDYIGIDDLSDTAVMINELNYDAYKLLCQKHAAAFIVVAGKYYNSSENSDLVPRPMRPAFLENGKIPGFSI